MEIIIWSVAVLAGLGLIFGAGLGIASKKLAVKTDERVEKVREFLPGANCGGCGYPGCDGFAAAIVKEGRDPSGCCVCSQENLQEIGKIMGKSVNTAERRVARVLCGGDKGKCKNKAEYDGLMDCKAAAVVAGGFKQCAVGCLGLGTCAKVCPFGAIKVGRGNIAEVDEALCTGCGKCAAECPVHGIVLMNQKNATYVACRNQDKGKAVLSVCEAGCIACRLCEKVCPEGAIAMENNLPVIDYEKCTGCGLCAEKCKPGCLVFLGAQEEEAADEAV